MQSSPQNYSARQREIIGLTFGQTQSMIGEILFRGRVALLGIAQRTIRVKYAANMGNQDRAKVLKLNIKTAGDWLKVKQIGKNLTPGHVAQKMGIATSLVCSWESSIRRPDGRQLKVLAAALGFDAKNFEAFASGH